MTPRFLSEPPITLHNPVIESCYVVIIIRSYSIKAIAHTSTMYMIRSAASSFGKLALKPHESQAQLPKYLKMFERIANIRVYMSENSYCKTSPD